MNGDGLHVVKGTQVQDGLLAARSSAEREGGHPGPGIGTEGAEGPARTSNPRPPLPCGSHGSCSFGQADRTHVGERTHTLEVRPDRSPTRPTLETKFILLRVTRFAPPGARRSSIEKSDGLRTRVAPQGASAPGPWGHRRGVSRFPRSCASPKAETAKRSRSLRTAGSSRAETVLQRQGAGLIRSFIAIQGVRCLATEASATR
jgi:hypothetical protein